MRWKRDRLAEIDLMLLIDSRESLTLKEICDALSHKYFHRYKDWTTYRATVRFRLGKMLKGGVVTSEGSMRKRKWSLTSKGREYLSLSLLYKQAVLDKELRQFGGPYEHFHGIPSSSRVHQPSQTIMEGEYH